jgi:cysteine desulfurase family protein (TIGR01976 family)
MNALFPNPTRIRGRFPALAQSTAFLDNAGGSHLPDCVIEAMTRYMRTAFVQTGGDYRASQEATQNIARARGVVRMFLGAPGDGASAGDVIFGSSSTVLCYALASAIAEARQKAAPGSDLARRDQIVVCTAGHEANVGPWLKLAARGFEIVPWQVEWDARERAWRPSLETLRRLVGARTRLVTFPQVSNILGEVWDAAEVARIAREAGARSVIDGVAYAPHRVPDVRALGCDWYVYSTYKVFGPHMAAMFGRADAFAELVGPNHEFIDRSAGPSKWELGGANHEGCAGVSALWEYVCWLADLSRGRPHERPPAELSRGPFLEAFAAIRAIEEDLQERTLAYLRSKAGVRIIGPNRSGEHRLCIISFVSERASPEQISRHLASRDIGIRRGHAYSKRLIEAMGMDAAAGIARVSFQHYNTHAEVDRLCAALDEVL